MANTYRISKVLPSQGSAAPGVAGYFVPEFSQDAGTTWAPVFSIPKGSVLDAQQALSFIVENEADFNAQVAAGKLVPTVTTEAYP